MSLYPSRRRGPPSEVSEQDAQHAPRARYDAPIGSSLLGNLFGIGGSFSDDVSSSGSNLIHGAVSSGASAAAHYMLGSEGGAVLDALGVPSYIGAHVADWAQSLSAASRSSIVTLMDSSSILPPSIASGDLRLTLLTGSEATTELSVDDIPVQSGDTELNDLILEMAIFDPFPKSLSLNFAIGSRKPLPRLGNSRPAFFPLTAHNLSAVH